MEMWGIWSKEEVLGGAEGETGTKKKKGCRCKGQILPEVLFKNGFSFFRISLQPQFRSLALTQCLNSNGSMSTLEAGQQSLDVSTHLCAALPTLSSAASPLGGSRATLWLHF